MPDPDFLEGVIGKPIAELSPERREQIQRWLGQAPEYAPVNSVLDITNERFE
jgi:hypothetical protein